MMDHCGNGMPYVDYSGISEDRVISDYILNDPQL